MLEVLVFLGMIMLMLNNDKFKSDHANWKRKVSQELGPKTKTAHAWTRTIKAADIETSQSNR